MNRVEWKHIVCALCCLDVGFGAITYLPLSVTCIGMMKSCEDGAWCDVCLLWLWIICNCSYTICFIICRFNIFSFVILFGLCVIFSALLPKCFCYVCSVIDHRIRTSS